MVPNRAYTNVCALSNSIIRVSVERYVADRALHYDTVRSCPLFCPLLLVPASKQGVVR